MAITDYSGAFTGAQIDAVLTDAQADHNVLAGVRADLLAETSARETAVSELRDAVSGISPYAVYTSPVQLTAGTDLNTLTSPGAWKADSGSLAKTLINTPYYATGFRLEVRLIHTANYLTQTIYPGGEQGGSHCYRRNRYVGVWGSWYHYTGEAVPVLPAQSSQNAMALLTEEVTECDS